MSPLELTVLLDAVRSGGVPVAEAAARLAAVGIADLGFASLDLDRRKRCGFPEVILAEGKTAEWTLSLIHI